MSKITVKVDPQLDEEFQKNSTRWSHRITIVLKDGRVIRERVDFPLGDPKNAFSWDIEDRKFRQLTSDLLGTGTEKLLGKLHAFEQLDDMNILFEDS